MNIPQKLKGSKEEERVKHAVDLLMNRMNFDPGKRYNLLKREKHDWDGKRPAGDGLLRMDEHWKKVEPLKKIKFPRKKDSARNQTAIEDIKSREDFEEWFQENLGDLEPGVYGILQRQGDTHGTTPMFVLRWNGAEVTDWKRRSNSQKGAGVGEASEYLGLPYYFMHLERLGVN